MIFEKEVFTKLISLFSRYFQFCIQTTRDPAQQVMLHQTVNSSATSGQKEHHAGDDGGPAGGVDDLHQDDGQDLLRPLQLW